MHGIWNKSYRIYSVVDLHREQFNHHQTKHCPKPLMGKLFWEGAKEKRKKL
jgi:hypothetical protein